MNSPYVSGVGEIPTADIAVPQYDRVLQFYSRVLSTGENPLWREDLMNNCGIPVIGLGKSSAEYADLPLQWMPHIQVADIAQSVKHALDMGGSEVYHGRDDDGKSQWALLLDPNGAAFGLIPVISEDEITSATSSDGDTSFGCISWLDLTVTKASLISDFYQTVIGWSVQETEEQDASERYIDYNMLGDADTPSARVRHARGANKDLPSVWMLYLPVGDIAESLRRVKEEGGKIIKQKIGIDGVYAYAIIQDPVGVSLGLVPG